jgi:hypothetical protein
MAWPTGRVNLVSPWRGCACVIRRLPLLATFNR